MILSRISLAIRVLLRGMPELPQKDDKEATQTDALVAFSTHNRQLREGTIEGSDRSPITRSAMDDVYIEERMDARKVAFDSAESKKRWVGDEAGPKTPGQFGIPEQLQNWFMSQSFIGWQSCAIIAQHWLVNKACSMAGIDAVRHGYETNIIHKKGSGPTKDPDTKGSGKTPDGVDADHADDEVIDRIKEIDTNFNIRQHCSDLMKFCNVFGIRVCVYVVDYDDPDAYSKPFNIDAVKKGSYKGIRQIDPYWCAPMLDTQAAADQADLRFYKPTWWVIGGRRYHWTHLFVATGPEVSDILKPQYYYGGLPMTQHIYERVYAAERTANEAPLLAMSKRTTALHVDLKKLAADQQGFLTRLSQWVNYRDNHAIKVLGTEETMEESDTSLSDFDAVIMNQYQIVSAISETPATKLLGTSPKGFNATGDFEAKSYHEKLESIQSNYYTPFLSRHYELLCKSEGWDFAIEPAWNPVDAKTAEQLAEINDKKSQTGERLINAGVISSDEERQRLKDDKYSGYNNVCSDESANTDLMEPGDLEKPGSRERGEASLEEAEDADNQQQRSPEGVGVASSELEPDNTAETIELTKKLLSALEEIEKGRAKGKGKTVNPTVKRGVKPTAIPSIKSELRGDLGPRNEEDLPKKVVNGYTVAIENPAGTFRNGIGADGKKWSSQMPADYGYFIGTVGADGDGLDIFLGQNDDPSHVYIVNQKNPNTGDFDEHKVFMGFNDIKHAEDTYHRAYGRDWQGFGDITAVSHGAFRNWVSTGDMTQPFSKDWKIKGQTANSHSPMIE